MATSKALVRTVRKRVIVAMRRVGDEVDIMRPDSVAENMFGKESDTDRTYTNVGTAFAYRSYGSQSDIPVEAITPGGRVDQDTPNIVMPWSTSVQADDELVFPDGERYRVEELIPRETHYESQTATVSQ